MDEATLKFGLTAFAILLVVADPFGLLPIFISLARNQPARKRSRLATRAVVLGFRFRSSSWWLGTLRLLFSESPCPRFRSAVAADTGHVARP